MNRLIKFILKIFGIFAAIYGILFAVFYFDLDGKFFYYVFEPMMVKHFDQMKHKDIMDTPYAQDVK